METLLELPPPTAAAVLALPIGGYVTVTSRRGRKIAVLRTLDGGLAALDAHCHHQGAELGDGRGRMELVDIEDTGRSSPGCAVRCPRHGYLIDVDSGRACRHEQGGGAASVTAASPVQRAHAVSVAPDGIVKLTISDALPGGMPSDPFNLPSLAFATPLAPPTLSTGIGGVSQLSFARRKFRATAAITEASKRSEQRQPSSVSPDKTASIPNASTTSAMRGASVLRQTTLFGFATPQVAPRVEADGMDVTP